MCHHSEDWDEVWNSDRLAYVERINTSFGPICHVVDENGQTLVKVGTIEEGESWCIRNSYRIWKINVFTVN